MNRIPFEKHTILNLDKSTSNSLLLKSNFSQSLVQVMATDLLHIYSLKIHPHDLFRSVSPAFQHTPEQTLVSMLSRMLSSHINSFCVSDQSLCLNASIPGPVVFSYTFTLALEPDPRVFYENVLEVLSVLAGGCDDVFGVIDGGREVLIAAWNSEKVAVEEREEQEGEEVVADNTKTEVSIDQEAVEMKNRIELQERLQARKSQPKKKRILM